MHLDTLKSVNTLLVIMVGKANTNTAEERLKCWVQKLPTFLLMRQRRTSQNWLPSIRSIEGFRSTLQARIRKGDVKQSWENKWSSRKIGWKKKLCMKRLQQAFSQTTDSSLKHVHTQNFRRLCVQSYKWICCFPWIWKSLECRVSPHNEDCAQVCKGQNCCWATRGAHSHNKKGVGQKNCISRAHEPP